MNQPDHLAQTLLKSHGLQVKALIRRRTVTGVVAENGQRFIWKPKLIRDDEVRLQALSRLEKVYADSGLADAALPLRALNGSFVVHLSETESGYLQPWLDGRHVDVRVRAERLCVLTSLARVQKASQDAWHPGYEILQRGTLIAKLRVKERALKRIWETSEKAYPALGVWRTFVFEQMAYVIHAYHGSLMKNRSSWKECAAFCHRDLAPHNVLWQPNGHVGWIDFDHAGYDDMLADALQFWSHTMFLARLTWQEAQEMLDVYGQVAGLSADRQKTFLTLARWPDVLIRSLIEWYRGGCRAQGVTKIRYALVCERRRLAFFRNWGAGQKRLDA